MYLRLLVLSIFFLTTPILTSAAVVSGYGVFSSASTSDGGTISTVEDGGELSTNASSAENTHASASSSAWFSGSNTTHLPMLNGAASASSGKNAIASVFGVQGYTFNGADNTNLTLNFTLSGDIAGNLGGDSLNALIGEVRVIKANDLTWDRNMGALLFDAPQGQGQELGINGARLEFPGANQSVVNSVSFDVDNGDDFFVIAHLGAYASDGFAIMSGNLALDFSDDTGLTAAATTVVPIPAAVWLFGSGLLGLLGLNRRRMTAS